MEHLLLRFPTNEARLAYETTIPTTKQISKTDYDICFAIPYGKKAFLWHTFDGDRKVAVLIEMNRENTFGSVSFLCSEGIEGIEEDPKKNRDFELGTIVSGVIYEEEVRKKLDEEHKKVFVIDDIHMYRGHQITRKTFREKSGYLFDFLQNQRYDLPIVLPVFWNTDSSSREDIPYTVRHYQYRSSSRILPHLCMSVLKKPGSVPVPSVRPPPSFLEVEVESEKSQSINRRFQMNWRFDFSKPAYRKTAFFYVRADTMFDVYFLGTMTMDRQEKTIVYCQNALVLNYKTSIFLNSIFRNIRENANIDAIEESDDEDDFEDVRENKYVDLEKEVVMECSFHYKFKKWMPFRVAQATANGKDPREKVTSIFSL